jgi:gas vesicle protein
MRMPEGSEARAMRAMGVFSGWSGFIMGATVGVVIGLLLAPKSGRETRGILGERVGQSRERMARENQPKEEQQWVYL